jgi:hypothetical protein
MEIQVKEKCPTCDGHSGQENEPDGNGRGSRGVIVTKAWSRCGVCGGSGETYRWVTQTEWIKSLKGDALALLANRLQGMSTMEAIHGRR